MITFEFSQEEQVALLGMVRRALERIQHQIERTGEAQQKLDLQMKRYVLQKLLAQMDSEYILEA